MDDEQVADMFGKTEGFVAKATGRNPETVVAAEDELKKKTFRSKLEESVADILDKVGAKYEYETHKLLIPYSTITIQTFA